MRFVLTDEQRDFARRSTTLLAVRGHRRPSPAPGPTATASPGLKLWARLAEQGVTVAGHRRRPPVEVCVAFEALGRHAVPGPVGRVRGVPAGRCSAARSTGIATVAVPPHVPLALDADVADHGATSCAGRLGARPRSGELRRSVDPDARLFDVTRTGGLGRALARSPRPPRRVRPGRAGDLAPSCSGSASTCSTTGRRTSSSASSSAARSGRTRRSSTSWPTSGSPSTSRGRWCSARALGRGPGVSAAKVACGGRGVPRRPHRPPGARRRSATPQELDLSLWLTKVRALVTAWGTPGVPPRPDPASRLVGLMEFALTEEQEELAATVRSLLAKQADSGAVRTAIATEPGTTRRSGRRCASRSAWPRWPSPRSTTAPARPSSRPRSCSRSSAARSRPHPLLASAGRRRRRCSCTGPTSDAKPRLLPRIAGRRRSPPSRSATPPVLDGDRRDRRWSPPATAWSRSTDATRRASAGVDGPDDPAPPRVDAATTRIGRRRRRPLARRRRARWPPPSQVGAAAARLDMTVAYTQGARAVRPADRVVPGAQAPDGRHAGRWSRSADRRPGPPAYARLRHRRRPTTRASSPAQRGRQGLLLRRARPRRRRDASSCTAASPSPGSTTPTWSSSAPTPSGQLFGPAARAPRRAVLC